MLTMAFMAALLYQTEQSRVASARLVAHTHEVINTIDSLSELMSRIGVAQLLFLLSKKEEFILLRDQRAEQFSSEINRVEFLTGDNAQQQKRVRELRDRFSRRYALMRQVEGLRRMDGPDGNRYQSDFALGQEQTQEILDACSALKREELRLLALRTESAAVSYRTALGILAFIGCTSVVIILFCYLYSTRQKRARDRADSRLRVMADALPGVMYQALLEPGKEWQVLFVSSGVHALLGIDASTPVRREHLLDAMDERDRLAYLAAVERAHQADGIFRHDYRLRRADGSTVWVHHQATMTRQENGTLLSHGYLYDNTEQIELEHELKRANEAALQAKEAADNANLAKGSFLAAMSHEIRTPMHGVIGMLELLDRSRLDDNQRRALSIVRESSKSLLRLINDILDYSKIEAGKMEVRPEPVSIAQKVEDLYLLNSGYAAGKGVQLKRVIDARISPSLMADRQKLRQILHNFLSNAIRFTADGVVTIRAELLAQDDVTDTVRIAVEDTGIGIPPEDHERIFEPFMQAALANPRGPDGTGLGLSICRRYAQLLGARIDLESEVGVGTTISITLTLPRSTQPPATAAGATADASPASDKPMRQAARVLVVDDHPINRIVLLHQFDQLGYEAECADNGEDGFALWQSGRFGIVFTDCWMPGTMDGYALARAIRAEEASMGLRRTPIIACTANAFADAVEASLAAGMDAHLSKPLELHHLRDALKLWLPEADGESALVSSASAMPVPMPVTPAPEDADASEVFASFGDIDDAGRRALARQLRASNEEDAAALHAAFAAGDCAAAKRLAHRMAGANLLVGARAFAAACHAIAHPHGEDEGSAIAAVMPRFEAEHARLHASLDALCGEPSGARVEV